MISKTEKKGAKKWLGNSYVKPVIQHLNNLGIKNKKGKPYSEDSIQKIMCGKRENKIIEHEIFNLIEKEKLRKQQETKQDKKDRKNILSKKTNYKITT